MEVRGSNPRVRIELIRQPGLVIQIELVIKFGGVAQLGEHLLCKQRVMGSSPFTSTSRSESEIFKKGLASREEIWIILGPLSGTRGNAINRHKGTHERRFWLLTHQSAVARMGTPHETLRSEF